jgi:sulfhydrogenase subunit beta (sulfur reductase)
MKKEAIKEFIESSKQFGELWGAKQKGSVYIYDKIDDLSQLTLTPKRTFLPIKKLIMPSNFTMLRFDKEQYFSEEEDVHKKVVFGVPPCDIHGLLILDDIFKTHYPDPYYIKRREQTIVIGSSFCEPGEGCFCKSMGTDVAEDGFDLFFSDLQDFYLVWVGSSVGDDMIRTVPHLFDSNITRGQLAKFVECKKERDSKFTRSIDMSVVPDIMELSYDNSMWNELGEKCLECGACTIVCPTCNCFNVVDESSFSGEQGERKKHWDCCIFSEFSLVADGYNFRATRADRLKLWYTHKLKSFGYSGKPSCVGCGRCVNTCPVDINVLSVTKELLGGRTPFAPTRSGKK